MEESTFNQYLTFTLDGEQYAVPVGKVREVPGAAPANDTAVAGNATAAGNTTAAGNATAAGHADSAGDAVADS